MAADPSGDSDAGRACRRSCRPRRASRPWRRRSSMTALRPARMASATDLDVRPSMTISSTAMVSASSSDFTAPFSVGQNASLVEATAPLYFEPTFEPERTMPPGNGVITSGTLAMASTAASVASSRPARSRPSISRLPPPTPSVVKPHLSSMTNSPSMTGTRQKRRLPSFLAVCQPSPKKRGACARPIFVGLSRPL